MVTSSLPERVLLCNAAPTSQPVAEAPPCFSGSLPTSSRAGQLWFPLAHRLSRGGRFSLTACAPRTFLLNALLTQTRIKLLQVWDRALFFLLPFPVPYDDSLLNYFMMRIL